MKEIETIITANKVVAEPRKIKTSYTMEVMGDMGYWISPEDREELDRHLLRKITEEVINEALMDAGIRTKDGK